MHTIKIPQKDGESFVVGCLVSGGLFPDGMFPVSNHTTLYEAALHCAWYNGGDHPDIAKAQLRNRPPLDYERDPLGVAMLVIENLEKKRQDASPSIVSTIDFTLDKITELLKPHARRKNWAALKRLLGMDEQIETKIVCTVDKEAIEKALATPEAQASSVKIISQSRRRVAGAIGVDLAATEPNEDTEPTQETVHEIFGADCQIFRYGGKTFILRKNPNGVCSTIGAGNSLERAMRVADANHGYQIGGSTKRAQFDLQKAEEGHALITAGAEVIKTFRASTSPTPFYCETESGRGFYVNEHGFSSASGPSFDDLLLDLEAEAEKPISAFDDEVLKDIPKETLADAEWMSAYKAERAILAAQLEIDALYALNISTEYFKINPLAARDKLQAILAAKQIWGEATTVCEGFRNKVHHWFIGTAERHDAYGAGLTIPTAFADARNRGHMKKFFEGVVNIALPQSYADKLKDGAQKNPSEGDHGTGDLNAAVMEEWHPLPIHAIFTDEIWLAFLRDILRDLPDRNIGDLQRRIMAKIQETQERMGAIRAEKTDWSNAFRKMQMETAAKNFFRSMRYDDAHSPEKALALAKQIWNSKAALADGPPFVKQDGDVFLVGCGKKVFGAHAANYLAAFIEAYCHGHIEDNRQLRRPTERTQPTEAPKGCEPPDWNVLFEKPITHETHADYVAKCIWGPTGRAGLQQNILKRGAEFLVGFEEIPGKFAHATAEECWDVAFIKAAELGYMKHLKNLPAKYQGAQGGIQ